MASLPSYRGGPAGGIALWVVKLGATSRQAVFEGRALEVAEVGHASACPASETRLGLAVARRGKLKHALQAVGRTLFLPVSSGWSVLAEVMFVA